MNSQLLTKKDIEFDNLNFWYFYIFRFRGCDHQKELNLPDAIKKVVDIKKYITSFKDWYEKILPKEDADNEGYFENPKVIAGNLTNEMRFAIEFHLYDIKKLKEHEEKGVQLYNRPNTEAIASNLDDIFKISI